MKTPMISVVMPVYNGEKYLREAIESILNQTYTDFEFIILNDGSTDRTEEIIFSYDDSRIVYVKNSENLQIVKTLNKGIALAKGKYIARMDADDISLPERFEKQLKFMDGNPDIDICGSYIKMFGERNGIWKMPLIHDEIAVELLFGPSFAHPTIMGKRSFFSKFHYIEDYDRTEDYALWTESSKESKFANLSDILLLYRVHEVQISSHFKNIQQMQSIQIKYNFLSDFKSRLSDKDLKNIIMFTNKSIEFSPEFEKMFLSFFELNKECQLFSPALLEKRISLEYFELIKSNKSLRNLLAFINSPLKRYSQLSIVYLYGSFIKIMLNKILPLK